MMDEVTAQLDLVKVYHKHTTRIYINELRPFTDESRACNYYKKLCTSQLYPLPPSPTPLPPNGKGGERPANVRDYDILNAPQCRGSTGVVVLRQNSYLRFYLYPTLIFHCLPYPPPPPRPTRDWGKRVWLLLSSCHCSAASFSKACDGGMSFPRYSPWVGEVDRNDRCM